MEYSDLHAHLGSMVKPKKLWELAHEQGIKLPTKDYHEFIKIIDGSLDDKSSMSHHKYLDKFNLTQKIQGSPLAVEHSVFSAISESYINHNITLLEIRFNPMLRNRDNFFDVDSVITHACIGLQKAMSVYPVKAGIIISTDRSFDKIKSVILAEKASKFAYMGVVGFDMSGGNIDGFNIKDFEYPFTIAKINGLKTTIHSAEVENISLEETQYIVDNFNIDRIGHGIMSIKDKKLIKKISDKGIHLEICPTSNVVTKCVNGYGSFKHIFKILNDNSISYSINTDGNVFLNTNIKHEYKMLVDSGSITYSNIDWLENESRKHSFIKL